MPLYHFIAGWSAFIMFLASCCFSLVKRTNLKKHLKSFNYIKLLNLHCLFAVISILFAIVHIGEGILHPSFSSSFICFYALLLACVSGSLMKYFKKVTLRLRLMVYALHIASTLIFLAFLLFHILSYYLELHP